MKPDTFLQLFILELIVYALQIIFYFGCEKFQKNLHNVERPVDRKVPMIPWSVVVYSLWFPMIGAFPMIAFMTSHDVAFMYMVCIAVCDIISIPIYMIYPTTFTRPELGDGLGDRLCGFIRGASYRGLNCAPSLHCSQCMVTIFCAVVSPMAIGLKVMFILVSLGIIISTQTTKQHVLIDAVTAIPVAVIAAIIGYITL